jgi:hypothetical protein
MPTVLIKASDNFVVVRMEVLFHRVNSGSDDLRL